VTENDGGGGLFFYDASDATSTNLGTIFKPAASAGRWTRQYNGSLEVEWFGASQSATAAANRVAVQGAFDAAGVDGESVTFSRLYTVNDYLLAPAATTIKGLTSRSSGGAGVNFQITTNANVNLFSPANVNFNQLTLDNMTLKIDAASDFTGATTVRVLYATGSRFMVLKNCFIAGGEGVVAGPSYVGAEFVSPTGSGDNIFDVLIDKNWFQGNDIDMYLHGQGSTVTQLQVPIGFVIRDNQFMSLTSNTNNANLKMTGAVSTTIAGNEFNNSGESLGVGSYSIWMDGCHFVNTIGNYFDGGDNGKKRVLFDAAFDTMLGVQMIETMITSASIYNNTGGLEDFYTIWEGWTAGDIKMNGATFRDLTASKVVFSDGSKKLTSTGTAGVDQGGTGAATLTGILYGNGTSPITAGNGTANTISKFSASSPGLADSTITDAGSGAITARQSVSGGVRSLNVANTSADASSSSALTLEVNQSASGDPYVEFLIAGIVQWRVGLDNSDSDHFKISVTQFGPGQDILDIASSGDIIHNFGNYIMTQAGKGIQIKEGSNARMGVATLVGGTIAVANTSVTANTRVFISRSTTGGTEGTLSTTQIASTSFTVNSTSGTDTSTVNWLLIEPSP
jgi:hypothetical protein